MGPSTSAAPTPEPSGYRAGDLLIDIGQQRVTRAEAELPLSQLSFELLLALARAAPNVLSLDQLMDRVWPGLVITPETVSQRVKLVRDAIGDDSQSPRYIAGVRGRGYKMVATVTPLAAVATSDATADITSHPPAGTGSIPRLAIPIAGPGFAKTLGVGLVVIVLAISASILTTYLGRQHSHAAPTESDQSVLVQQPRTIAVLPLVDLSQTVATTTSAMGSRRSCRAASPVFQDFGSPHKPRRSHTREAMRTSGRLGAHLAYGTSSKAVCDAKATTSGSRRS